MQPVNSGDDRMKMSRAAYADMFGPGQTGDVTLVALAGKRVVYRFGQEVSGKL
jgi:urease beta subunit